MNSTFFHQVKQALASERLDAYGQDHASEQVVLARYLWNIAVCEALYSPMQMAEVALRNAAHRVLTAKYQTDAWYDHAPLSPWQQAEVGKAKATLTQRRKPITAGRVIAELHFGFWTAFFNKSHESTGLAHAIAKHAFSKAPSTERGAQKLHQRWDQVRALRNRAFHHERIIHWSDLRQQHADILALTGWISPELAEVEMKLDRFSPVYQAGIGPWCDKVKMHWAKEVVQ